MPYFNFTQEIGEPDLVTEEILGIKSEASFYLSTSAAEGLRSSRVADITGLQNISTLQDLCFFPWNPDLKRRLMGEENYKIKHVPNIQENISTLKDLRFLPCHPDLRRRLMGEENYKIKHKWKNVNHNSFHRKSFKDEMLLLYSSNIISCFLFIYFNILVKCAILYCLVYLNLCNLQRRNQCTRLQKIYLDDERCVYLFAFP
ncbi:hypothetical protein NC653_024589 [Populus alba x Populus x berolinensis]|uniref:Uncharacterized protein n=1 Tax=Populus alba x Populus x berolinensis TaxID=444605 RepID=A0AAD6Q805_9ROSI|nr:hypothetical protein NC653_024589 [Populus alba x Populus x berolinensis]